VIGSASRAGAALCTAEVLAMLVIGLVRLRDPKTGLPTSSTTAVFVMIPVVAAALTFAVGWDRVWQRFQQNDPYLVRREYIVAAVHMAKDRPLMGYGLGTFPEVYQQYAIKDFGFYANHAHNDWAEFAADGGIPHLVQKDNQPQSVPDIHVQSRRTAQSPHSQNLPSRRLLQLPLPIGESG
jgi:O-antigen ligase